jgi:hypothetical protein
MLGMVVCTCNCNTQEAEAGGLQVKLYSDSLYQRERERKK